ncbi:MAG: SDR family oxidoreductase [Chloroherpetonaceae bacterium]|nr:SDR family oxidoreductase [Chloroherpetonaceae bacterium]
MSSSHSRWRLDGHKTLVTGGTKGIGRAIAEEFLALGAEVFIVARTGKDVFELINAWQAKGLKAEGLALDLTLAPSLEHLSTAVQNKWGKLDALVLNTGTNIRKATTEYSDADIEKIFQTNLFSAFELARLFKPLLSGSPNPSLTFIGSVAGERVVKTGAPYAMTKSALAQLSRYLSVEWSKDKIRVNTLQPWYIQTPLAEAVLQNPIYLSEVLARTPLGRIGTPEEVSAAAAFLAMPAASYITGEVISIDGGFMKYGFSFSG